MCTCQKRRLGAKYLGRYLKKPPIAGSRLAHYAGGATLSFRYHDHNTGEQATETLTQRDIVSRLKQHIPEKFFRMVRYYGFLSPSKRAVLEVVYLLTETARKTARKVTWRGLYQRLLKVDAAGVHSVRQNDVLQRPETGDASGGVDGLSRAAGADENLRVRPGTGKICPAVAKLLKNRCKITTPMNARLLIVNSEHKNRISSA
ncbi:hypothetical protein NVIRENTERO_00574 [Sodalis praecaptivus]|nr:hypothetical protein NVIRENTERO_00574 [Sodalis praecaptivus]